MAKFEYVPILKGKQGELDALTNIDPALKGSFAPLVELPTIPLEWGPELNQSAPKKTIDEHVKYIAPRLARALKDYKTCFIDGFYIQEEDDLDSGEEPSEFIFGQLRKKHIPFVPTTGLDRVDAYARAVKAATKEDGRGFCLRLSSEDLELEPDGLQAGIQSLLSFMGLEPTEVDLLLDFGPEVPPKSPMPLQINALPFLNEWRSLILASSAFPKDMSDVEQHSIEELDRKEWSLWAYLRSHKRLIRMPIYSDYGINHPISIEIDPRIMRQSPNIRYSSSNTYVLAKGAAYPRKKDKISEAKRTALKPEVQYPKLAKLVTVHESWQGKHFSEGDRLIHACSRKEFVGSPQNWRMIGMCHHIAFVLQQLANLREPV